MTAPATQTFDNHKRYIQGYHFVAGTLVTVILLWSLVRLFRDPGSATAYAFLTAIVLAQLFWYTRQFPIRVQDRVICLEERLRLAQLLPSDLRTRVPEFDPGQLIALRFASDSELPALARRVLTDQMHDREAIKRLITSWRPDMVRA